MIDEFLVLDSDFEISDKIGTKVKITKDAIMFSRNDNFIWLRHSEFAGVINAWKKFIDKEVK